MSRTLLFLTLALASCSVAHPSVEMTPLSFEGAAQAPAPVPLENDHFARDRIGGVGEDQLKEILAAPVFLEEHARLGVIPVAVRYAPDEEVPTVAVPAALVDRLEESGLFEMASEISTEWPTDRGLPGLRELAARYRSEYLLLYRHRFVEDLGHNGWAAGYATIIGALFFPGQQVEVSGVLEATLYDVKTGTILFTVNQRLRATDSAAPTTQANAARRLQQKMLADGAPQLADLVVAKCRRLAASRPVIERQEKTALTH